MSDTRRFFEHKSPQHTLHEPEDISPELEHHYHDVVWSAEIDPETKKIIVTSVSSSITRLRGITVEEAKNETLEDMFTPESLNLAQKSLQNELSLEKSITNDPNRVRKIRLEMLCKDGSTVWTETIFSFIRDHDGNLIGFQGLTRNISELVVAEKRKDLTIKVLKILNSPGEGMDQIVKIATLIREHVQVNAIGVRIQKNADFPYYYCEGLPEDFIRIENSVCALDKDGEVMLDSDGHPILVCMCGAVLCQERELSTSYLNENGSFYTNNSTDFVKSADPAKLPPRMRRRCQQDGYESLALIPLRTKEKIFGLLQLNHFEPDKFANEIIEFLQELCESIGAALQRKETYEQLLHAQKLEALGLLVGGVAHDFNTLIFIISTSVDMLKISIEGMESNRDILLIKATIEKITKLINKLILFSKDHALQQKILDVKDIILDFEQFIKRLLYKNIKLNVDLAPDLYPVFGDSGQIEQVLMNLAINGRDAMPNGGILTIKAKNVTIDAEGIQAADTNENVVITISDTGEGIHPMILSKIFNPFFTTKNPDKGSGLGLAVSNSIIANHDGKIYVKSEMAVGTKFTIWLPAHLEKQKDTHSRV